MRVFTFVRLGGDLLVQRQALCIWARIWKDQGYDPHVVTPEMRPPLDLTKLLKASQQPEDMFARWYAPSVKLKFDQVLMVEPGVLPAIHASQFPDRGKHPFIRYDTVGRVIYAQKSPVMMLKEFVRHDFGEFEGRAFTDWDLVLLDYPDAPTVDCTVRHGEQSTGPWFVEYTQPQLLEMRAERLKA